MKFRLITVIALVTSLLGFVPANAAENRVVTGVSAYIRVDLGYLVGWTLPADTRGITGYTVTASGTGVKCVVKGAVVGCSLSLQRIEAAELNRGHTDHVQAAHQ